MTLPSLLAIVVPKNTTCTGFEPRPLALHAHSQPLSQYPRHFREKIRIYKVNCKDLSNLIVIIIVNATILCLASVEMSLYVWYIVILYWVDVI